MSPSTRLALRPFTQHRGVALVAMLGLGLGVGTSVAVYSVVDGVVLEPLPYTAPERLITWWDTNPQKGLAREPLSPVNFLDYRSLDVLGAAALLLAATLLACLPAAARAMRVDPAAGLRVE